MFSALVHCMRFPHSPLLLLPKWMRGLLLACLVFSLYSCQACSGDIHNWHSRTFFTKLEWSLSSNSVLQQNAELLNRNCRKTEQWIRRGILAIILVTWASHDKYKIIHCLIHGSCITFWYQFCSGIRSGTSKIPSTSCINDKYMYVYNILSGITAL